MDRFDFIETKNEDAPFSFFKNLFWREDISMEDQTGRQILRHELTHMEQLHTYDKLLITLLTALFWMNPFMWIIRKELEVIHEFIADEKAVDEADASALATMLLQTHYQSSILSTGQSFFYSSIKRRIIMLTSSKKVSYSYARRILTLPLAIGIIALLSFTIKDQLNDQSQHAEMPETAAQNDTIPSQYRDAKTGKIKGSFQIDINGDTAVFKDVRSKKKLFEVPLNELAGPAKKVITVEGFPLNTEKKFIFISSDSMHAGATFIGTEEELPNLLKGSSALTAPHIVINGKEISPTDLNKIDPSSIKTIDIRGTEKVGAASIKNMNGMTLVESTTTDGKKMITVKVDSVIFDGKANVAVSAQANAGVTKVTIDTTEWKTVLDNKSKSSVNTVIIKTSDDNIAGKAEKDPRTLTVTTTDKDGKKTYTIVQKQTEKTELPKDVLYIIDGKEMESKSMKDIDPTTIKSINVLKGENAIKKYGERAKNGVIEIATKKN
jgi:uncharacterized protein YggU (UPF0235/DUF167 family)